MDNPNPNPKSQALAPRGGGRPSIWNQMDPKLRKKIDREIIVGDISQEEIGKKYGLSRATVLRRRAKLLEAAADLADGKAGSRIKSQAREVLGWTQAKVRETYELAKSQRQVLMTKDGPVMQVRKDPDGVPVYDIAGKEVLEPMSIEAPLLPAMIGALKEARELARVYGEMEGLVGRVRELREQAMLQSGAASAGLLGPGSTIQTMNVLVMPKDPEVEELEKRRLLSSGKLEVVEDEDEELDAEEEEWED